MNKTEMLAKVAEMTGVGADTCGKVIDAFQKVLQEELAANNAGGLLDKLGGALNFLKGEK